MKGSEHPDAAEAARLKQTSCDVKASVVCMRAWYGGYRLSRDFYEGDRAMRESGFDTSAIVSAPSPAPRITTRPVGLNSLLYRYERDMEHLALPACQFRRRAWAGTAARSCAERRHPSLPVAGERGRVCRLRLRALSSSSNYAFITSLYPLWTGVATREEAKSIEAKLSLFERPGGLSTSNTIAACNGTCLTDGHPPTGSLWQGSTPPAIAPTRPASRLISMPPWTAGFAADGTIREKYNVVAGNAQMSKSAPVTSKT